jgi:hypothetical protein
VVRLGEMLPRRDRAKELEMVAILDPGRDAEALGEVALVAVRLDRALACEVRVPGRPGEVFGEVAVVPARLDRALACEVRVPGRLGEVLDLFAGGEPLLDRVPPARADVLLAELPAGLRLPIGRVGFQLSPLPEREPDLVPDAPAIL